MVSINKPSLIFYLLCSSIFHIISGQTNIRDVFSHKSALRPKNSWLEAGQAYADDFSWVNVTTVSTTFVAPIILLSMPSTTQNDPLSLRIRNKRTNALGQISFQIKVRYCLIFIFLVVFL